MALDPCGFLSKGEQINFLFLCFLWGFGLFCGGGVFFGVCFLLSVLVLLQFFLLSCPERCIQRWHFIQYISPHSVTGENGKEVLLG